MYRCRSWILALAVGLGLSHPALAQHGRGVVYEVVSISAKEMQIFAGGSEAMALDINNQGAMVGFGGTATGVRHAFKRDLLGATTDIGAAHPSHETRAYGINDNGEVVGWRRQSPTDGFYLPFYWSAISGLLNLSRSDTLGATSPGGAAAAINGHGRIAGCLHDEGQCRPVTWWHRSADPTPVTTPAGAFDTPSPAGTSAWLEDVSDSGWMTGTEEGLSNYETAGFRLRFENFEYLPDPSPIAEGTGNAVNEAGTVVGTTVYPGYGARAIMYRRFGAPLILGLPAGGVHSFGSDINESEFVVGHSDVQVSATSEELRERAFLFHLEFGMIELPPPSGFRTPLHTNCRALALNDRKENGLLQVAGYCTRNGKAQAMRWDVFVGERVE